MKKRKNEEKENDGKIRNKKKIDIRRKKIPKESPIQVCFKKVCFLYTSMLLKKIDKRRKKIPEESPTQVGF